jgi:hypothetical protein
MSHWVRFCTTCPIPNCPDPNRVIYWLHADDDGVEEINEEGYVRCKKSGCRLNKNPCFILDMTFGCKNHPDQKVEKMALFNALSFVSCGELGLYESEVKRLLTKILKY